MPSANITAEKRGISSVANPDMPQNSPGPAIFSINSRFPGSGLNIFAKPDSM